MRRPSNKYNVGAVGVGVTVGVAVGNGSGVIILTDMLGGTPSNQALPFLFPALERSMREVDFAYNLRPDGGMRFRLALPLELREIDFVPRPCADGQFGNILKVYRDWKISGDSEWLLRLWPHVRLALEYAWSPANPDRWDPEKSGILTGRQHHTLDMELFGPNAWLTGFYLAALKACAEMAEAVVGRSRTHCNPDRVTLTVRQ